MALGMTVDQLISDAYNMIAVTNNQTALTGQQYNDGLNALNYEIDSLNASGMNTPYFTDVQFNLTPGQAIYTVGQLNTCDVQVNRPISIDYITYIFNQVQYPVHVDSRKEWLQTFRQVQNLQPAPPQECFVQPQRDQTVITFYFPPDQDYECHIYSKQVLDRFTAHSTALNIPPYYYKLFKYILAAELSRSYPGKAVWTDAMQKELTTLKANQKMNNQVNLDIKASCAMLGESPSSGNYLSPIFSGY